MKEGKPQTIIFNAYIDLCFMNNMSVDEIFEPFKNISRRSKVRYRKHILERIKAPKPREKK